MYNEDPARADDNLRCTAVNSLQSIIAHRGPQT